MSVYLAPFHSYSTSRSALVRDGRFVGKSSTVLHTNTSDGLQPIPTDSVNKGTAAMLVEQTKEVLEKSFVYVHQWQRRRNVKTTYGKTLIVVILCLLKKGTNYSQFRVGK